MCVVGNETTKSWLHARSCNVRWGLASLYVYVLIGSIITGYIVNLIVWDYLSL